jgi:PTS system mannose-specific IID component
MSNKLILSKEEKKDINTLFWRQMTVMAEMTYIRMQGPGFGWSLMPLLKKIYKDDEKAYYEALQRNMMYFNTNPAFVPFIQGIVYSMEKENAKKPIENFNESVNGLKIGLMGPLAGLGDSFFTGTLRVIAAGVGMGMAMSGNILGPILFLLIYNIPFYFVRYYGAVVGYKLGSSYIQEATQSGVLKSITKGCSLLGMMMIGAMTYLNVPFKLTVVHELAGAKLDLQAVLDSIMKGILPLTMVLVSLVLLKKGKSANWLLIALLIFSVIAGGLGIAG